MNTMTNTITTKDLATEELLDNFEKRVCSFLKTSEFEEKIGPHSQLKDAWKTIGDRSIVKILNHPYHQDTQVPNRTYFQAIFDSPKHLEEIKHIFIYCDHYILLNLLVKENKNLIDYLYEITNSTDGDRIDFLNSLPSEQRSTLIWTAKSFLSTPFTGKSGDSEVQKTCEYYSQSWKKIAVSYPKFDKIQENLEKIEKKFKTLKPQNTPKELLWDKVENIAQFIVDIELSSSFQNLAQEFYYLSYVNYLSKYCTYSSNKENLLLKGEFLKILVDGPITSAHKETVIGMLSNSVALRNQKYAYQQIPTMLEYGEILRKNKIFKEKNDLEKILQAVDTSKKILKI